MSDPGGINNLQALGAVLLVGLLIVAGIWSATRDSDDDDANEPGNRAPTIELVSPLNGSTLNSTSPLLVWNASDPDDNPLVYQVKLAPIGEELTVQYNAFTETWRVTNLTPGVSYNWCVEVDDGQVSNSSEVFTFHIEALPVNRPPSVELISPQNDTTLNSTSPKLVWIGSDPDGGPLQYEVKMAPVGEELEVRHYTNSTSWTATNLTPGTSYVWCVNGTDGEASNTSELFTFHIDYTERALEIMAGMNLSQKIGQMITGTVGRFSGDLEQKTNMIKAGELGGVLTYREEVTTDAKGILNFTNDLQNHSLNSTGVPLLMIGDFEGGKMMEYANLMSEWPNPMTLGAANDSGLAYDLGRYYGTEMSALGFNMAYAPVFDVNTNPDNPIIAVRSYGSDPELVTNMGLQVIAGNRDAGIISTIKHFPGHGDTSVDSHSGLNILNFTRERVYSVELAPFAAAIEAGVPAIMTAHISIPVLDDTNAPATLSKPILTDLVRGEFGFEGVIVTDSIGMGAIAAYLAQNNMTREEGAVLAINSGSDILLWTGNYDELRMFHTVLVDAVNSGNITQERVNESVLRILVMKLKFGLFDRYPVSFDNLELLRAPEHVATAREIAYNSIVIVNSTAGLLPLNLSRDKPILIISPNNLLQEDGNLSLVNFLRAKEYNATGLMIGHSVSSQDYDDALEQANESALVILATHHFSWNPSYYGNSQIELAEALYDLSQEYSIPMILLSVENPYDLRQLPSFNPMIVAINSKPVTMEAVVDGIIGDAPFLGIMPVVL